MPLLAARRVLNRGSIKPALMLVRAAFPGMAPSRGITTITTTTTTTTTTTVTIGNTGDATTSNPPPSISGSVENDEKWHKDPYIFGDGQDPEDRAEEEKTQSQSR